MVDWLGAVFLKSQSMQYAKARARGDSEEGNVKRRRQMIRIISFCGYYYLIKMTEGKKWGTPPGKTISRRVRSGSVEL